MSVITDVVLHIHYAPEEVLSRLEEPFTTKGGRSGTFEECLTKLSTEEAGGTKVFTGDIYAGSYSFLNDRELLGWLKNLMRDTYADAVLSLAHESYVEVHLVKDGELSEMQTNTNEGR